MIIVVGADDALTPIKQRAWDKARLSFSYPGFYDDCRSLDDVIGTFSWAVGMMIVLDPATIVKGLRRKT